MIYIILIAILVAIDQILKLVVVGTLDVGQSMTLIDGVFNFTFVQNTGAAFSLFKDNQIILIGVTSAIILAILIYIIVHRRVSRKYKIPYRLTNFSLSLILGGGIGNLIDRIINGYVVDYIQFMKINFPVFNFADCCVVLGAFLLILAVFVPSKRKRIGRDNRILAKQQKKQKNWEAESQNIRDSINRQKDIYNESLAEAERAADNRDCTPDGDYDESVSTQ